MSLGTIVQDLFGELPDALLDPEILPAAWRERIQPIVDHLKADGLEVYIGQDAAFGAPEGFLRLGYVYRADLWRSKPLWAPPAVGARRSRADGLAPHPSHAAVSPPLSSDRLTAYEAQTLLLQDIRTHPPEAALYQLGHSLMTELMDVVGETALEDCHGLIGEALIGAFHSAAQRVERDVDKARDQLSGLVRNFDGPRCSTPRSKRPRTRRAPPTSPPWPWRSSAMRPRPPAPRRPARAGAPGRGR